MTEHKKAVKEITKNLEQVRKLIIQLRVENGWTQEELAERAYLPVASIEQIETEKLIEKVTIDVLLLVSDAFGFDSVTDLFNQAKFNLITNTTGKNN